MNAMFQPAHTHPERILAKGVPVRDYDGPMRVSLPRPGEIANLTARFSGICAISAHDGRHEEAAATRRSAGRLTPAMSPSQEGAAV